MNAYETRLHRALVDQHRHWFDYTTENIKAEFAEYIACPACDATDASLTMTKDFFKFRRCNKCSMVFLNPRLDARRHTHSTIASGHRPKT